MTGIVWAPIGHVPDHLVILDAERRTYCGLSRDGSYWHLIRPASPGKADSLLACGCDSARFGNRCWRVKEAEAFEAGEARRAPTVPWLDAAPGELQEAYGK